MSTRFNQYVVLGAKLPYENNTYERFEKFEDNGYEKVKSHSGLTSLYDGRDGRYIIVGTVLSRSEVDETLDGPLELNADSTKCGFY